MTGNTVTELRVTKKLIMAVKITAFYAVAIAATTVKT
jgi:hypothetical protein